MIKVEKEEANYFDYCDVHGEVIDRGYMYNVKIGADNIRLCSRCFDELSKQIKTIDFVNSL